MAYKSKYTGLQIDDILDSVGSKQNEIEDLDQIRAGAEKGATALQSYTEKYTGTVTGVKMNGLSKGTEGIIDLGTVITAHQDISGKQDKLVSGTNIKTINGESILGEGDLTVEGGAKVYEWIPQTDETGNIMGTLTKDEFENIRDCDILLIGGIPCIKTSSIDSISISMSASSAGEDFSVGNIVILISSTTYRYFGSVQDAIIPTKTSQLENDSNFVSSDGLKTINGESIVGSGDIEVGKTNYVELSGASVTISSMLENTFYYDTTPLTSLTISAFTSSGNPKGEYKAVFKAADGMSLTLPSDVYWANGTIPDIEANVLYELSIERGLDIYKAVLVPFKAVE